MDFSTAVRPQTPKLARGSAVHHAPSGTGARTYALTLGIQSKGLRYGSVLALTGPVALSLEGDRLTASCAYKLF